MKKLVLAAAICGAFLGATSIPAMAEETPKPHQNHEATVNIKGEITKIDGKTVTVGEQSFTIGEKTEIVSAGHLYKEPLKVGQRVSARVREGIAQRVEVMAPHEAVAPKPHQQEEATVMVRGEITKIEGSTVTVGDKSFTISDKTEIVSGGHLYKEPLKVGQKVSARVKEGVAQRIEVQPHAM